MADERDQSGNGYDHVRLRRQRQSDIAQRFAERHGEPCAYDRWNRLSGKTYVRGTALATNAVDYTYDSHTVTGGGTSYPKGRLTEVAVSGGTKIRYDQYDAGGRVLKSSQATDSITYRFVYAYNAAGGLESIQYPSNRVVFTCYDTAGRAQSVRKDSAAGTDVYAEVADGTDPTTNLAVPGYSAMGGMQYLKLDSGKLLGRWDYNSRGQVTGLEMYKAPFSAANSLMKLQPGYGADASNNGNVMSQSITVEAGAFAATQAYTYDAVNRLSTVAEGSNWKQGFGYDRWGNRWIDETKTSGIAVPSGTPNGESWYSTGRNRIGADTLYDAAGNGSPVYGRTYAYDVENRMVSVDGGSAGLNEVFEYNGEGRRVKRTVDGQTTVYVYDAMGQLAAEYGGGAATAGRSYLFSDHVGSTRLQVAGDGTVQGWWDYAPFGEVVPGTAGGRSGVSGFPYGSSTVAVMFTGQVRDRLTTGAETGLDYFGARYFSGTQGRFTSPDPITTLKLEDPQRWNKYAYARGNPLRFIDPTGMYNTDCKSNDITKCSAEIQAFEARRQRDLKSDDQRVRRAAKAYGGFNDGNNVRLKFDPNATQGTARQDVDAKGRPKDSFTVTLPTSQAATSMVAHEGSHLADELDAMNGAKALTGLKSEILAYQTQAATMLDDPQRFNIGYQMNFPNNMVLLVPWSDLIDDVNAESIRAFLAVNPAYKATQQKNEGGPVYVKPPKK